MEIQNGGATPCKSEQLQYVNIIIWESRDIATHSGEIHKSKSKSIVFVLHASMIVNSNMTWFFSPIKSTDTNSALFPDKS